MEKDIALKEIPHTLAGVRTACLDEINGLRAGTTTIQKAKTIANLSRTVIQTVALDIALIQQEQTKQLN